MDLALCESLSGIEVPASNQALVTAQINRTKSMLETMLGFTLGPSGNVTQNIYNELGKSEQDCICPSVDTENLQPADPVIGAYRLFRYNQLDDYFHIDPASRVYAVKLVFIKEGSGNNGITIKTFDNDEVRMQYTNGEWLKYIEHCLDCLCSCECNECVQLAVDADWLWESASDIPEELLYVWVDMINFYSNPKHDIKSESIDTHSYTRDITKPEEDSYNLSVIKKYAGPYGSVVQMPV